MATSSRRAMLCGVAALPALTLPAVAGPVDPHEAYRDRLHVAHAEKRAARPIENEARYDSLEGRAANLVARRMWSLADEVIELPPPTTLRGLGVLGLAMALMCEGCVDDRYEEEWRTAQLARGVLAVTGEKLPSGWCCWGDAPGDYDRDLAVLHEPGWLPAWALAEAASQPA